MIKQLLILALLVSSLKVFAQEEEARWSLGLGIGPNLTNMDVVGDRLRSSFGAAVWMSREWGERSRLDISLDYFKFSGSGRDFPSLNVAYGWRFFKDSRFKPFLLGGAGIGQANNFPLTVDRHQEAFDLFARAGVSNLLLGDRWNVGLIIDFEHVFMDGKPITSAQLALPMLTFTWSFENSSKQPEPLVSGIQQVQDSDRDGVQDDIDECPNTRRGKRVNSIGCEPKQKVVKTLKVEFETAKDVILPNFMPEIEEFKVYLDKNPDLIVSIEGHTDSVGRHAYNTKLSDDRANSVRSELIRRGISGSRLKAKGFGPDKPVADNDTPTGRQLNRRVNAVIESNE